MVCSYSHGHLCTKNHLLEARIYRTYDRHVKGRAREIYAGREDVGDAIDRKK